MTLLAVQSKGARLDAREEALTVSCSGRVVESFPAHEVSEVHCYGAVEVGAAARRLLLARGVDVLFLTPRGEYRGRLLSPLSAHGERRRAQYGALARPEVALNLARACVRGKVQNARNLLARLRGERRGRAVRAALAGLRQALRRCDEASCVEALRGVEGHAAALYFEALGEAFVHPELVFSGRNRRPPRDPINACLSFGYTLLLRRVESAVLAAGLDPYLGALHEPGRSKPALALDLMEELRPLLVDRLVLRLVNTRQLAGSDFEHPGLASGLASAPPQPGEALDGEGSDAPEAGRAVYLAPSGRSIFLRALAAAWERRFPHPERGDRYTLRALVEERALRLAQAFAEGSEDPHSPLVLP